MYLTGRVEEETMHSELLISQSKRSDSVLPVLVLPTEDNALSNMIKAPGDTSKQHLKLWYIDPNANLVWSETSS